MSDKLSNKYNDSCIKLFKFINMLYDNSAEFKKVIELFSDGNYDGKSNTHVTLNKYLNALKLFGVNVRKINNRYQLQSSLYKMQFSLEDLKILARIKSACELLPKGKNKKNLEEFIRNLELRFDEKTLNMAHIIEKAENENVPFYNSEMKEQIRRCEEYCLHECRLEILYKNDDNDKINLLCIPKELVYLKKSVNLKVLGNNGSRIYDIPIDKILSIKPLPTYATAAAIPTTVVYKIKNRLAKNYKIRDWERVDKIEHDGSQIIINKGEDFNLLLKRIMKYGIEAEILSPKYVKDEMIELINKTLSNYQ